VFNHSVRICITILHVTGAISTDYFAVQNIPTGPYNINQQDALYAVNLFQQ